MKNLNEKQNKQLAIFVTAVIAILLIVEVVVFGVLLYKEGFSYIFALTLNDDKDYLIRERELVPRDDMASFLVTDDEIFLFYDSTGIVNTYSLDGEFKYGIQFATSTHKTGDIACFDGVLLIKSRRSVIFEFDDKDFVRALSYSEDEAKFKRIEQQMEARGKNHTAESETYYYWESTNQILKEDKDGERSVVIELPQKSDLVGLLGICILLTAIGLSKFHSFARVWLVKKK